MAYTHISLFAGCGGLDIGFKQAGFKTLWANDFFLDAVKTYRLNLGDHITYGDITKIDCTDIPSDFDVLTGGFPCQGFSIANSKRSMEDQRNFLYRELLRLLSEKKPKVFIAENVKGLLSMESGKVIKMILNDFSSLGYKVDYQVLRASDYGVPQHRERVIIIGNRIGSPNIFPTSTHSNGGSLFAPNKKTHISVKDAISFLEHIRTRDEAIDFNGLKIYNHVARNNVNDCFMGRKHQIDQHELCDYLREWRDKSGISVKKIDALLGYKHTAGHWFRKDTSGSIPTASDWIELKKILKLDDLWDDRILTFVEKKIVFEQSLRISNWDTPSDTITASGPEIHPNKQRRLSVRECAILQGFPMDFIFTGSISAMYKQIGNAVPPPLSYAIAMAIKEMLNK